MTRHSTLRLQLGLVVVSLLFATAGPFADDWPEFRGPGRRGVWNETGIVDRFPASGLKVLWRAPVKAGYSGPVVAGGRVFLTDFVPRDGPRPRGTERILCFRREDRQAALETGMGRQLRAVCEHERAACHADC